MSFNVPGVVLLLALLAICVLSGARRKPGGMIFHPLIRGECGPRPAPAGHFTIFADAAILPPTVLARPSRRLSLGPAPRPARLAHAGT
jgi:hypothetical protein